MPMLKQFFMIEIQLRAEWTRVETLQSFILTNESFTVQKKFKKLNVKIISVLGNFSLKKFSREAKEPGITVFQ